MNGAGPLVWSQIAPGGGSFTVATGQRYAALASVTRDQTLPAVVNYLSGHGWLVTYAWEQGQASRNTYAVDDWLSSLAPDTAGNHRWVWIEADRTGATATLGQSAPWPFTFYSIAHAFLATPAPPGASASAAPGPALPPASSIAAPSAGPSPAAIAVGAGAAVGLGLLGYYLFGL